MYKKNEDIKDKGGLSAELELQEDIQNCSLGEIHNRFILPIRDNSLAYVSEPKNEGFDDYRIT